MDNKHAGTITSEGEAIAQGATEAGLWLAKIRERWKEEEDWRKEAALAVAVFEARTRVAGMAYSRPTFNIFHSNIQTLVPAIYNSTPVPDVRRRYGQKDKIARLAGTLCERLLTCQLDGFDFDHSMKRTVRASAISGRGASRVRYIGQLGTVDDEDTGEQVERLVHEQTVVEHVKWDRFLIGPADAWEQVPWIAYQHDLTKDTVARLLEPDQPEIMDVPDMGEAMDEAQAAEMQAQAASYADAVAAQMEDYEKRLEEARQRLALLPFGNSRKPDAVEDQSKPQSGTLATVRCWEVWDKASRKVIWLAEDDELLPLAVHDDPLEIESFFDMPRPLCQVEGESSMVPVCPHSVYADLIAEIDDVTKRIKATVEDMRVRSLSDPKLAGDLEMLATAKDGETISASLSEMFVKGAPVRLEDMVLFWPVEQDVKVLQALMAQRDQIKQTIYEVTGISDILRGATEASETATAQQIKATWGSQRVQDMQAEAQRYARDLFRLMAEVAFNKFEDETIREMTLLPEPVNPEAIAASVPPPQPQPQQGVDPMTGQPMQPDPAAMQAEHQAMIEQAVAQAEQQAEADFAAALQMMRGQLARFRVDIETDSTIKADMARDQQMMDQFLQGTAAFGQSMAQVAPILPALVPHMTKIYTAFVRKTMKLGKSIEDVLDEMEEAAMEPPTPQGPQADPQAEAEAMAAQDEMAGRQHQRDLEMEEAKGANIERKNAAIDMKADAQERNFGQEVFLRQLAPALPPGRARDAAADGRSPNG